ncbi:MAG: hypothetical protein IJU95_06045 [Treponema sp.]|nr:hypothetical protein [Treponema sp.]
MTTEREKETAARLQQSARVERVLSWRKYIATLREEDFFDIIRIYLGEVPTPYNKQDLVEELSAFIRKDENKKGIIRLLSGIDLKLLAAVKFIPRADVDKLAEFFSSAMTKKQVSAHVDNLIQRLLIFYTGGNDKRPEYLCINPLLEDKLLDLLDIDILLPSYRCVKKDAENDTDIIDAGKISALISYILAHPDLTKSDGTFKKKSTEELEEKIGNVEQLQLLLNSLRNLGIFNENESGKKLLADWERAESFANLDSQNQRAYLCTATIGHLSRGSMYDSAQLLYDTFLCAKEKHYSKEALVRLSFLIRQNKQERSYDWSSRGRFQSIITRSSWNDSRNPNANAEGSIDTAIEAAITFGYIVKKGMDDEGQAIYCINPVFFEKNNSKDDRKKESVKIDAAFTFMIMPGLSLQDLLPLAKFLEIVKYDKVLSFEANKKSVMRSFDTGMTAQKIKDTISQYTSYPIPQNLDVTLDEWFGSYSSASLYKGYVLKVSGENEILVRRNPFLSRHIIETFAPGLYLLDFTDDIMAQAAIKQCGLDFIGKIKSKETEKSSISFYSLNQNENVLSYSEGDGKNAVSDGILLKKEQDELLESLKLKVNTMRIPQEQKDGLIARIDRRVIVNEDQLRPESVRFEKLEALGMDYQGKVHVIENSILAKCLVEITSGEGDGAFLGEVTAFTKYEGEAEVTVKRDDGTEKTFSVSKASLVRKVSRQLNF